jgi:hypothetical protein
MALKNDKARDLTPLETSFIPGESPQAQKLQGMIRQSDAAIAWIENRLGDLNGEEGFFNTWISTLARNLGSFADLNPAVLPNYEVFDYNQTLTIGQVEHELDMVPVGNLSSLLSSTLDSSVVISQWKSTVAELQIPGDWTIVSSHIENGKIKRGRKLVTHAPSEGGSIVFSRVTTGRGSSLEDTSENTIPNLAQAEDNGPFPEFEIVDSFTKTYQVTLPVRTKMYDKTGQIVNFTASNSQSGVGLNSQHELPQWFFGLDGLGLDSDEVGGGAKSIPLNLISLYDWDTKKQIEGVISLQASPSPAARRYQFILQTKQDVILNISGGRYVIVVAGNSIAKQIKALTNVVYGNTGDGNDMTRLINHKNLLGLRTGSVNITNRSKYYGPSSINNNDHSMYFHRDGYTSTDLGAGGNVVRGDLVVGSTVTGASDSIHENFNIDADSYALRFGNIQNGPEIKYAKTKTYSIDHAYGTIPLGIVDAGLWIQGAVSDLDPSRKNIFLEGDIRTNGNVVLGKVASDTIFMQGRVYINDELTLIPRLTSGVTGEEGKFIYSSNEKAPIYYNGASWVTPWNLSGYTTTIGDGVISFGKYNGQSYATFVSALADVTGGGSIKILPGSYNILANKINIPENVTLEGSGERTVLTGSGTIFETVGANASVKNLKVNNALVGLRATGANTHLKDVTFSTCGTGIQATVTGTELRILDNVIFNNCSKSIDYPNTQLISSLQTVMKSAVTYSERTVNDWALKNEVLNDLVISSGVAVLTFDPALDGAIGKGAFKVTGTGVIVGRKFLPVNANVGIGGHINIRIPATTPSGAATASVGVICYDANYNNLGTRYFIASGQALNTNSMDDAFYKGMMVAFTGMTGLMFPSGTRFVQPVLAITANTTSVIFDSFEIDNMTYARVATWS